MDKTFLSPIWKPLRAKEGSSRLRSTPQPWAAVRTGGQGARLQLCASPLPSPPACMNWTGNPGAGLPSFAHALTTLAAGCWLSL